MKAPVLCLALLVTMVHLCAQDSTAVDSLAARAHVPPRVVHSLDEVVVRAYETNKKLTEVPAAVSVVTKAQLNRFNNSSLVSAMNTNPGVRMEERSPGSYRLNIRGSTLRSPFGVRNVKVYYDDIPYTDPGGNTYFNQLGFYNISSMEIIKGPGSSLYGAGTGGVILLNSDDEKFSRGVTVDYTGGSFNSHNAHLNIRGGNEDFHNSVNYLYQTSDGYRIHTNMSRKVVSWDGYAKVGSKGTLKAHFLQGDLFYETPGALTRAEYDANPKSARPHAGQTPGAVENKASISQKLFIAGLSYKTVWDKHFQSTSSLYGAFSKLLNPTTRNYERRSEPHFGSRNVLQYQDHLKGDAVLTVLGGVELQQQYTASRVYSNKQGDPDTLQADNEITNTQAFGFLQGNLELHNGWVLTAGASLTLLNVELQTLSIPMADQKKKYNNQVAPRVALLKKITPLISVYGSVAKGFSPPTSEELLPSTGVITSGLEAEEGWNTEVGARGNLLRGRLYFDINAFNFNLLHTISQRRDASGGDYFINAGSTRQKGLETFVSYRLDENNAENATHYKIWVSHTWSNFHYRHFEKVADDTTDYSGNRLPSVPKTYLSAGLDANLRSGLYGNLTYYYSDPVPLNDANTATADSYNLVDIRLGYRTKLCSRVSGEVYAAADNIFDVKYSLGNDINALGGRYFNAAPGRNFSGGISVKFNW